MPVELELLPGQSSNSSGAAGSEANFGNGLSQASQENSAQLLQGFAQMQNAVQASIAELTVLVKSLQASASPGDVIAREGSALNLPPAVVPEGGNGETAPRKNQDEVLMLCERLFLDQGKIFDQVLDHRLNTQFQKIETVIANGRVPNGLRRRQICQRRDLEFSRQMSQCLQETLCDQLSQSLTCPWLRLGRSWSNPQCLLPTVR
jgi:hypothetical protein